MDKLNVCRLCLEIINDHNCETLNPVKLAMLKVLLLNLSPVYTTDASICCQCCDKLQCAFHFKTSCLDHNDNIKTFLHHGDNFPLVLEEIIVKEIPTKDEIKHEEEKVCRFCLKYFNIGLFTKLSRLEEDIFLKDMLEKCLPEVDLNITNVPLMCFECMDMLQNQFNFVISCLDVDERINHFRSSPAASNHQHDLSDILKFDDNHTDSIDIKSIRENGNGVEYASELVVKKEEPFDDIEESQFEEKESLELKVKQEEILSAECIKIEENFKLDVDSEEEVSDGACQSDQLTFPEPKALEKNEYGMFVCMFCPHQTNRRDSLVTHFLTHKRKTDISQFKCEECDFVTKWSSSLRSHSMLHRNQTELRFFYCAKCPYKSLHKTHVRRHSKRHMKWKSSSSSTDVYDCQYCSITTIHKTYFKQHNKVKHSKNIILPLEQCEQCNYQSKIERNVLIHMKTVHNIGKDFPLLKKTYACESCDYMAAKSSHFKDHLLRHKSCGEVKMFNCAQCDFQTKYRNSLILHLKRHAAGWQPRNKRRANTREPVEKSSS